MGVIVLNFMSIWDTIFAIKILNVYGLNWGESLLLTFFLPNVYYYLNLCYLVLCHIRFYFCYKPKDPFAVEFLWSRDILFSRFSLLMYTILISSNFTEDTVQSQVPITVVLLVHCLSMT